MANCYWFTSILFAFTAGILILLMTQTTPTSAVTYPSQYVNYTYTYSYSYLRCTRRYYTYCYRWYYYRYWLYRWHYGPYYYRYYYYHPYFYRWGYWPCCYYRRLFYSYYCYRVYRTRTVTRQRCRSGWTGSRCNIPVCNPTCSNSQVCTYSSATRKNTCSCQSTAGGGTCQIVPCSPQDNCYPGTCQSGNRCNCPSGFNGTNCLTINQQPSIGECWVKLYARPTASSAERVVGQATCEADGLDPLTAWVGDGLDFGRPDKGITKLEVNWKAEYDNQLSMPVRPRSPFFIKNTPVRIGISEGSFNVHFTGFTSNRQYCKGLSASDPRDATTDHCVLLRTWSRLGYTSQLVHNNTMTISVFNKLGGQKEGDSAYGSTYGFQPQTFTGDEATKQAKFQFDLKRPSHCLLKNDVANVRDRKTNCSVFPIWLGEDITSNRTVSPTFLGWNDDASGLHRFEVEVYLLRPGTSGSLVQLGTPEISATVTPDLNNFHFVAREPGVYAVVVTVYDAANNSARARKILNYNDQPGFEQTDEPIRFIGSNSSSFITTVDSDTTLTLSWAGRFITKREELSRRVEPWPISQNTINDVYGTTFGLRSIDAVRGAVGIATITCLYRVEKNSGDDGAERPEVDSEVPDHAVMSNCSTDVDKETTTLELASPVANGDTVVVWLNVSDHRGQAGTIIVKIKATVDRTRPDVSQQEFVVNRDSIYESYVEITVVDPESGIDSIRYKVVDRRNNNNVLVEDVVPAKTRYAPGTKRRKRDTGPQQPCTDDDDTCYCIPRGDCFAYKQEVMIDHCDIDRYKGNDHKLVFLYVVTNLAGRDTPENEIPLAEIGDVECRPHTLPAGVIAGIVIAVLIGLLLLILLIIICVLMLMRIRQNKHPLPQRFRTMADHARKRFTMRRDATQENDLYTPGDQPPAYPGQQRHQMHHVNPAVNLGMDDDMYLDRNGLSPGKIPRRQLQMTSTLAEGRFAVVRKAHLDSGKEKSVVAAKALKNGFSKGDEILMATKIEFMKDLPPHGNIVRFIGEVDDGSGEGPIMVLEMCEESLKDWLGRRSSMNTDDLEALLGFALNIARGVEHLHSHQLLHRRLGVRNVLLQQQASGLVAKLIGFGPLDEDMDNPSDKAGAGTSAPIKWLAPETLDTLSNKKPKYDEKTDAWSYGITLWEMYSKGAPPFSEVRSADVKAHIKQGNRLTCPADCPPELYDSVVYPCWNEKANKRPSFSAICQSIEEFRRGAHEPTGYYERGDDSSSYDDRDEDRDSQIYADGK